MILEDFHIFHIAKILNWELKNTFFNSIKFYRNNLLFECEKFNLLFLCINDFSTILKLNKREYREFLKIKNINFLNLGEMKTPFKIVSVKKVEDERVIFFEVVDGCGFNKRIFLNFIPHNTSFKLDENFRENRRLDLENVQIDFNLPETILRKKILKKVKFTSPLILDKFFGEGEISRERLNFLIDKFYSSDMFYLLTKGKMVEDVFNISPEEMKILPFKPKEAFFIESKNILDLLKIFTFYLVKYYKFKELKEKVLKNLKNKLRDVEKKIFSLTSQIENARDFKRYKTWGDLISANLHIINGWERLSKVDLFDFEGNKVEIELDSKKTVLENRDYFYKKFSKLERARRENPEKLKIAEKERIKLLKMINDVEKSYEFKTIEDYFKRNISLLPEKVKDIGKRKKVKFRKFITSDGYVVLAGRGAKENDELTFKFASPYDLWFHVSDYSGSHVLLLKKNKKKDPPFSSILEAAEIAAYYSKAPKGDVIDVRWTERKHVLKIKGTPGLVRLRKFNTLRVLPQLPPERKMEETK